ncbi:MAG: dTDP-4-dehydrorhamnose reductase [Acidimicrobiales bacterium]
MVVVGVDRRRCAVPGGALVSRVMVTGASGQVGTELVSVLAAAGHRVIEAPHSRLDVSNRDAVGAAVEESRPETVVHAAAWTDVDGCQTDPDRAWRVNAVGTRNVAEASRRVGARVVYVSSDYVFDGAGPPGSAANPGSGSTMAATPGPGGYTEWDPTGPLSVYGRSKLAGEGELSPDDTVVRTSWVCGRYGRNFVRTILSRARSGSPLRVVDDQHGCPTMATDLAAMIARLVGERRPGLFHVTNGGPTTWFDFARSSLAAAGLDPDLVSPISTARMDPPRPAPRPAWSVLDNAALRAAGIPLLRHHSEALEELVDHLMAEDAPQPATVTQRIPAPSRVAPEGMEKRMLRSTP